MEVKVLQRPSSLSTGNFDRLDDDVLSHIIKACDMTGVLRLRRVCKGMKSVIESIPRVQLNHLKSLGIGIELDRNKPLCKDTIASVAVLVNRSKLKVKNLDQRLQRRLVQHISRNECECDLLMVQLSKSRHVDIRISTARLKKFPLHICRAMSQRDADPEVRRALKSYLKRSENMALFQPVSTNFRSSVFQP